MSFLSQLKRVRGGEETQAQAQAQAQVASAQLMRHVAVVTWH